MHVLPVLALGALFTLGCADLGDKVNGPAASDSTSFASEVLPILTGNCTSCHGAGGNANLDLSSHAGLLAGGDNGPGVVPGNSAGSLIVQRITSADPNLRMPLGRSALNETLIQTIRDWIDEGAQNN